MEASRRAADESATQPQQRQSNQQKATSSSSSSSATHAKKTGAELLDADPLQSIANLLNHHSALKQQQQQQQQQRNRAKVTNEVSAAVGEQQQVDQVTGETGDSKAPARSKKTTGGVSEQSAEATLPADQCAKLQRLKQTNKPKPEPQLKSSFEPRERQEAGQVDQGNSYLYAYNDFITTNRKATAGSSLLASTAKPAAAAPTNSKLARQAQRALEQELKSDEQTLPPPPAVKNFFLSTKQKVFAATTAVQKLRATSSSSSSSSKQNVPKSDHKSPSARCQRREVDKTRTSELLTRLQRQQVGGGANDEEAPEAQTRRAQLVEGEVFASSVHEAELCRRHDDEAELREQELQEDEEEEEEEEDDTLSYILNRHNLRLAQQQQQQQNQLNQQVHLHEHTHVCATHQQADCLLICNQANHKQQHPKLIADTNSHSPEVDENPNHLRQYLQIEENFNSYKAAKRRLQPETLAFEPLGPLAEQPLAGIIELPPGGTAAPSGANTTGSNLHLPLANYIIATNELAEGDEFGYQTQLTQTRPLAPGATDYLQGVGVHEHSPNSSVESLSTLQHVQQGQNYTLASGHHLQNHHQHHNHRSHNLALLNQHAQQQRQHTRSYLQLLRFVKPKSLIGGSSGKGKMYSTASHQAASQQLAGQAGAYYVTSNTTGAHLAAGPSSSSSSEANLTAADNLISQSSQHCSHHQQARLLAAHQQQHHQTGHIHHLHHQHPNHAHYHHHHHHQQQQQSMLGAGYANYPPLTSSDSSLGSSGAFASSAVRATSSWLRDFCSKKCLFITCLMLILFIFVLVISLSAYLNFLISSSKTNLQPLSGRLRVDMLPSELMRNTTTDQQTTTLEQFATRLFANKSSAEFLQKQRDFETIIRGAMDRTQPALKSFPNHLVKLEVYAIRSASLPLASATGSLASLWIYFRLFLNKRTLQHDHQLMRRKAADEPLERQFLPRLTQQTLQSGFEQLLSSMPASNNRLILEIGTPNETSASSTPAALQGINSRRFGAAGQQPQIDSTQAAANRRLNTRAATSSTTTTTAARNNQAPREQLKSFDEQINRLMYLVEAIDLQSILVTSEFDMAQSMGLQQASSNQPQSMSDGLRASAPLNANQPTATTTTTTTTTMATPNRQAEFGNVMVASGGGAAAAGQPNGKLQDNDDNSASANKSTSTGGKERANEERQAPIRPALEDERAAASSSTQATSKFTLQQGYMENATRPSLPPASSSGKPAQVFLENHSQRKQMPTSSARPPTTPARPSANTQVVRLVSGQPVVSQGGQQRVLISTTQRTPPITTTTTTTTTTAASGNELAQVSSSTPTARPATSSSSTTGRSPQIVSSGSTSSIEELWNNALNSNNNLTSALDSNGRLISVTTIGSTDGEQRASASSSARPPSAQLQPSEWHKISVFSDDITDTIRTQLNSSSTSTARPPKVAPAVNIGGSLMANHHHQHQTPAVSISAQQNNAPQRQRPAAQAGNQVQKRPQNSAVILNRDIAMPNQANLAANSTNVRTPSVTQSSASTSSTSRPKAKKQKHNSANQMGRNSSPPNDRQQSRNGTSSATGNKPTGKPKAKKVTTTSAPADTWRNQTRPMQLASAQSQQSNATLATPTLVDGKGIPIVDNFLASIGSGGRVREQPPTSTLPNSLTTIELSRSTTPLPAAFSTGPADQSPALATETQPSSSSDSSGEFVVSNQQARPGTTSFSGQWRPITNNNQPRSSPINEDQDRSPPPNTSDDFWASARNRSQAPNLSLIVATERLPDTLGRATGSQSPFAMPNQMMMPSPIVRSSNLAVENGRFANRFQATSPQTRSAPPQNDFESHRVSRMRQSQAHSHRSSESSDPLAGLTSSSTSSSTTSTSSSTTTSSSLNLVDSGNSRIVDDFLITTDRNDPNNGRSSTLLPPLVLSALHRTSSGGSGEEQPAGVAPIGSLPISTLVQTPKRTRGPFAFETLRSLSFAESPLASQTLSPRTGELAPSSSTFHSRLDDFEPTASSARAERALEQQHVDDKVLARKQLFQAASKSDEPEMSSLFAINHAGVASESSLDAAIAGTGDGFEGNADEQLPSSTSNEGREFGNRRRPRDFSWKTDGGESVERTLDCEHFGCRARGSGEPTCLNKTQICDDFLDCQDESDELDCVSLMKLDPNTQQMSFSNGAGIIYLNRRGSLAPMCVDYYQPKVEQAAANSASDDSASSVISNRIRREHTGTAHELEAIQLEEAIKLQNELIRQINTIGQYACSLQSFSRLASVKINHNDQVDGLHLISSSAVFHKLSVAAAGSGLDVSDTGSHPSFGRSFNGSESFRSSGQFEVELSSSAECPSQRTVFVKCGGFECGQNAFHLEHGQQLSSTSSSSRNEANNLLNDKHKLAANDGVVINDFPWLVKLYWQKALSCHGYLIDESWLIAPANCFVNNRTTTTSNSNNNNEDDDGHDELALSTSSSAWTAEISRERYGKSDAPEEPLTRQIKLILRQPLANARVRAGNEEAAGGVEVDKRDRRASLAIVLAKLDRPVRFSPLNRPICLPSSASGHLDGQDKLASTTKQRDCISLALPSNWTAAHGVTTTTTTTTTRLADDSNLESVSSSNNLTPTQRHQQQQQKHSSTNSKERLLLNKVNLLEVTDCLASELEANNKNLLCADEISAPTIGQAQGADHLQSGAPNEDTATARVLICSQPTTQNPLRPKWTLVGVETSVRRPLASAPHSNGDQQPGRRLFAKISSQIDWIVDTMNPLTKLNTDMTPSTFANPRPSSEMSAADSSSGRAISSVATPPGERLRPPISASQANAASRNSNNEPQQATCNQFKCSSGECLSWSRICDGLYDCSSHDDEKDCHK